MSHRLVLPAPAKLNLFLHITDRRDDGYHLLQTIFQFLDYCDEITLSLNNDGVIRRLTDVPNVPAESDLMVKAATALQQRYAVEAGVDLIIDKKLPMGGGLGGGSSDAATVLHGCNQLWQLGLSTAELAEIGVQLGADVPVFVHGFAAWAEGIGEKLSPVSPSEYWYFVVHPNQSISTAEIFLKEGLTRDCEPIRIAHFLAGQTVNVFEAEVAKSCPEVAKALTWLSNYSPARLTGSGSCIFAPFNDRLSAEKALAELPKKWSGFIAKGVNKSPLLSTLQTYITQ